jgi:hypothetical protein
MSVDVAVVKPLLYHRRLEGRWERVIKGDGGVDEVGVGPRYGGWSLNWRGW